MTSVSNNFPDFHRKIFSFSVLHFLFGMVLSCYLPFFVVYLLDRKIDNTTIGIVLMLNALVSVFAQIFWGIISDRIGSIKKVFISCMLITILLNLSLTFIRNNFLPILILPLINFFLIPLIPLLDTWTLQGIKKDSGKSYGSIRLWSSIGYTITAALAGKLISLTSVNATFYLFGFTGLLIIIISFNLKKTSIVQKNESSTANRPDIKSILKLLKNYSFVTYLAACCLLYTAVSPMFSFIPKLMEHVGGNSELYGIAISVSALSEVPILFFSSKIIKRFKIQQILTGAFLFYAVRMLVLSLASTPQVIILAQVMQSLTYSLFLIGNVYYIDSLAPKELKATAQALGSSVFSGLGGIIGNSFAGRLIDRNGIVDAYKTGSVVCTIALILFIACQWFGKHFKKNSISVDTETDSIK